MAIHQFSILGVLQPDASGNVFFEPASVKGTNDVWPYLVLIYNDTATRLGAHGRFPVPQNYVGSPAIVVQWTTTATSGDVEFDFDYRAVGGDDAESLDQTSNQETVNQNDTAPSAAHERMTATLSLAAANFAPGDTVQCGLFRDGTDGGDTIAAAVIVHDVLFQYADV